jgi:glutathione S-transferase
MLFPSSLRIENGGSMALTLYYHPLSSYSHKAMIALYENDTPFTPHHLVNLQDDRERAEFARIWPIGKFPVLKDGDWTVPESSIIIEYLDHKYPGKTRFIPADPDLARQTRMHDRFFDLYVMERMMKIVDDRLRPEDKRDPYGVAQARARLDTALKLVDEAMSGKTWAMGEDFTMADCAAAPALFYADKVAPFGSKYPNVTGYLDRLMKRPSYARCIREATPYFELMPKG